MLVFSFNVDLHKNSPWTKRLEEHLAELAGEPCIILPQCSGVVRRLDGGLIFSVPFDLSGEDRKQMETGLSEKTGVPCVVLGCCDGVFRVQSESPNEGDEGNDRCDDIADPVPHLFPG